MQFYAIFSFTIMDYCVFNVPFDLNFRHFIITGFIYSFSFFFSSFACNIIYRLPAFLANQIALCFSGEYFRER